MSERKVLNKYYPPDFDASKIPRMKREKNRQFTIRLMAPFNMRCKTCGEYIYRGKKFNARKEDVIGKLYLGIQIYRFYIKCTKCLAEITFLTDPENQDYAMENGAIRNFECIRLAEKLAEAEAKQLKDEEENNPMKILENRTRDSRREMAVLETLEDLRELNTANMSVDPKILFEEEAELARQIEQREREEDEAEIRRILGKAKTLSRPKQTNGDDADDDDDDDDDEDEDEDEDDERSVKKQKTAATSSKAAIAEEQKANAKQSTEYNSILFPKGAASMPSSSSFSSEVGQLKKTNVASFIKKKIPAAEEKKETVPAAPPAAPPAVPSKPTSLATLLNAYGDSSSSSSDEE